MIAALVPVKRLAEAKSRLRAGLAPDVLERLTLAMLEDVLSTLCAAPELGRVAVVTEDPRVGHAARSVGADALVRHDDGLNASLDAASAELARDGARAVLVVLGDVPGIGPADVRALVDALAKLGGRGAILAPVRDGGTGALLRAPHDVLPSAFGPASAALHQRLARERGVPLHALTLPGLAVDLDRPEDMDFFLEGPGDGRRTRALLEGLRQERRP